MGTRPHDTRSTCPCWQGCSVAEGTAQERLTTVECAATQHAQRIAAGIEILSAVAGRIGIAESGLPKDLPHMFRVHSQALPAICRLPQVEAPAGKQPTGLVPSMPVGVVRAACLRRVIAPGIEVYFPTPRGPLPLGLTR